ncbi:MAG: FdhF/YdeP family oxidoreductase [Verrucomicrobia bacterium]|nr:FdhF/YdeP family oxidoreductase [Verrucomicrobiota bacterium]
MSHRVEMTAQERRAGWVPFGLGQTKPQHFRDMLRVVWKNRDNLGYAWNVISRGVCDGCALGVAGLHDWTIPGVHLCMTRLNLLRLNTMPELDPALLADVSKLKSYSNEQLRELGRLPYPMVREPGQAGFRRISWDEVNQRLGTRLRTIDPNRMAFFVTARGVTNEVYYVSQKVARFLGTNHVDNAARLCHAPSTGAMKHAIGYAASTCSYKDWYGTDLIVFFGANPANDQPVTTKYLHEAKQLGTKVVLVNPYLEPGMRKYWVPSSTQSALFGTDIADWWFPVTQGGDIPFLYAVLKVLIERKWVNEEFLQQHSADWAEFKAHCATLEFEPLVRSSGLSREAIEEFAELLHRSRNAVFVWSMGITQHVYGGDAVSMVLNLGLARGYVGRPKNGLMPIRGHSSVQGGAEMGCYSTALPGGKSITPENVAELSRQYGFPIPDRPGINSVEMVEAAAAGELDVLYCLGGNFLRTLPEPDAVATALERVPVRVHQDIILTDQMFLEAREAVYLLPAKTRYEQDGGGIETTTERRVAFSPEIPRQVGEAKAEWRILRDLAAAAWPERAHLLGCESGPAIREEIARIVPFYAGCEKLTKTGDAIQWGGERLCDEGRFATADGKAHFKVVALPARAVRPDLNPGETGNAETRSFVVSTRRGKQFNTLIYAEVDPLTGAPRDAIFMNPEDARSLGLVKGDRVTLVNRTGRYCGLVFPVALAPGNLQVHWPEGNVLLPKGVVDPTAGVPDYNAEVRVERG